jgi:hypothetical protein
MMEAEIILLFHETKVILAATYAPQRMILGKFSLEFLLFRNSDECNVTA